jgi:UDP-glucose 4-epimerase
MKILVTGSSGFIGGAIAEHLVASGHDVVGLHAHARPDADSKVSRDVVADIASADEIARLCKDVEPCDAIIHAAASLDMNLFATDISRVNCMGLQNMLWLSSQWRGKRFVFLSSLPVIGVPKFLPITEDHPATPLTAYHASKLFGEQIVRLAEKHGVTTMSLRLTAPVGPRMPKNRLLTVLVRRALNSEPLEISGRGTRKQNYIDVRDIAHATELCLQGNASGVFNIAAASSISNIDLAHHCIARCNSSSVTAFNGREDPEEGFAWDVSIEKARKELGFIPKYDIDDAIDAALAELRENGK